MARDLYSSCLGIKGSGKGLSSIRARAIPVRALALERPLVSPTMRVAHFELEAIAMADNKSIAGKQDRERINVNEDFELQGWSAHFGTTRERIREAVAAVGPIVKDVEGWLSSHQGGKPTSK